MCPPPHTPTHGALVCRMYRDYMYMYMYLLHVHSSVYNTSYLPHSTELTRRHAIGGGARGAAPGSPAAPIYTR